MSKCDIRITFDNPNRVYRGGDVVSGEVHITVNQDIRCNGIALSHFWKTHGRGNTDHGPVNELRLSEMLPLQAGEELRLPFEFTAECWPLSYHGHYINVDHYVKVAVDVPWAIDPKHEEEFILTAGSRPEEFTGQRGEVIEFSQSNAQASGALKVILFGVVAIFAIVLAAFSIIALPIVVAAAGIYWGRKKLIASRVGEVELKTPHRVIAPGEAFPIEMSFTPKSSFSVNNITLKIWAGEAATSGSGTNSTTHRHTLYDETHTLYPAGLLVAGEKFHERFTANIPKIEAWNLSAHSNKIQWTAEVRIDIPRFPDWSRKTDLQLVPVDYFDNPIVPAGSPPELADSYHSASIADELNGATTGYTDDELNTGISLSDDITQLSDLIANIQQVGRWGDKRQKLIAQADRKAFPVSMSITRSSPTLGFMEDDPQYEKGTTVIGKLTGTNAEVQLFSVEASNSSITGTDRSDTFQTMAFVKDWDSLYDRLVLHEVPFE